MQIEIEHPAQDHEDNLSWSSDDEIMGALDYLDSIDDTYGINNNKAFTMGSSRPNAHGGRFSRPVSSLQPTSNRIQKFSDHIYSSPMMECEENFNFHMSNSVTTETRQILRQTAIGNTRTRDKADRATSDGTLDPTTRMVLFKMISKRIFVYIDGCISTGKEANVYYAKSSAGMELAVKVYKTSILVFKNRSRYVKGDYRFTNGYSGNNPRKMVSMWAEKERRNLERLSKEGIKCPAPIHLNRNVLVMKFIGKERQAAPRLKDAVLPLAKLREGYFEIIKAMQTLYQECKLVHGDLSEYNILYFEGHMYIIDVSQSVQTVHPCSDKLLHEDCLHISNYFEKHGVDVMDIQELIDYIKPTKPDVESFSETSHQVEEIRSDPDTGDMTDLLSSVNLEPFSDQEEEQGVVNQEPFSDQEEEEKGIVVNPEPFSDQEEVEKGIVAPPYSDNSSSDSDGERGILSTRAEKKVARKENKKMVKQEKREARKNKISKAEKKRRKKLSKAPMTR